MSWLPSGQLPPLGLSQRPAVPAASGVDQLASQVAVEWTVVKLSGRVCFMVWG